MAEGKAIDEAAMQKRVDETKRIRAKMGATPMSEWAKDPEIRALIIPASYNYSVSKETPEQWAARMGKDVADWGAHYDSFVNTGMAAFERGLNSKKD